VLGSRTTILLAVATGVALELGIGAMSGRREAWDSSQYWTIGLPMAGVVSLAIGWLSRGRDWFWTLLVVPGQVLTMMVRSMEISGLWPLALIFSAILSTPFLIAAFIGSRFRPTPPRSTKNSSDSE
jgi:hypothetical protein